MAIPLRNVYYLLCYAWDRIEARELTDIGAVAGDRVEDLLGKVLADGVSHLIRQGLDRGYVCYEEETRRLRGKLMLSATLKRSLLHRGVAVCQVDELSHDVPHNRVIKAAMRDLIALPSLDRQLRVELREHCRRMSDVTDVPLAPEAFRQVQLHRNVARYAFLIGVCRLVAQSLLPDAETGRRQFRPFTANEQVMGILFESFVRNFLRIEQEHFRVRAVKVPWQVQADDSSDLDWLPEMRTDITLSNASQQVVIETKYYATPFHSRHGSKKLISSHLYQLLAYLTHIEEPGGRQPTGVLLYAGSRTIPKLDYTIERFDVLVRALDLDREWPEIHRDLIKLARELRQPTALAAG